MKGNNVLFNNCKELISLFLKPGDKPNFPKEIKISKKLLSLYPIEFWRQYSPNSYFSSLSVFLTKVAKKELEKEYSLFLLIQPQKSIILEDKPVIQLELTKENNKNRTLQEFVDNVL